MRWHTKCTVLVQKVNQDFAMLDYANCNMSRLPFNVHEVNQAIALDSANFNMPRKCSLKCRFLIAPFRLHTRCPLYPLHMHKVNLAFTMLDSANFTYLLTMSDFAKQNVCPMSVQRDKHPFHCHAQCKIII